MSSMQAPPRPSRTRASGGRTFMLLGVLLALAAGAIVIFVISQYAPSSVQTETVVVATQDLPAGSVLSTTQNGLVGSTTYDLISAVFVTKTVSTDFAPKDAYTFKTQADLNAFLNNEVVSNQFYAGEILRNPDPRLTPVGSGAPGSLTSNNPGQIKPGFVLEEVKLTGKPAVVAGDHVDIVATFCNIPGQANKCETQTTLQNVYVYAIRDSSVFVVVSHQDAVNLLYLTTNASNYELVIRKPGDSAPANTKPADNQVISSAFGY